MKRKGIESQEQQSNNSLRVASRCDIQVKNITKGATNRSHI